MWMWSVDRLGPDVPMTHWLLHSSYLGRWLCRKKFAAFGPGSAVRPYSYAINTSRIFIGANVIIRPQTVLSAGEEEPGRITIEDNVLMAPGVQIICDNHKFSDPSLPIIRQGYRSPLPVLIQEGAWLGASAIVLPGVTIGRNAVIGAGAVVVRSIPAFSVAVGNPARVIKNTQGPVAGCAPSREEA